MLCVEEIRDITVRESHTFYFIFHLLNLISKFKWFIIVMRLKFSKRAKYGQTDSSVGRALVLHAAIRGLIPGTTNGKPWACQEWLLSTKPGVIPEQYGLWLKTNKQKKSKVHVKYDTNTCDNKRKATLAINR